MFALDARAEHMLLVPLRPPGQGQGRPLTTLACQAGLLWG